MPESICDNLNRSLELLKSKTLEKLESDCLNPYGDPRIVCGCCTQCAGNVPTWKGDCPDGKIDLAFPEIWSYNKTVGDYNGINWNITNLKSNEDNLIFGDTTSYGKDLEYSACVASTDCFEYYVSTQNYDDLRIIFSIKVNGIEISAKDYDENNTGDTYTEKIKFGYNEKSRNLELNSCDKISFICEGQTQDSTDAMSMYRYAVKASGKKNVDNPTSNQNKVLCDLAKTTRPFDPDTFPQYYIIALFYSSLSGVQKSLLGCVNESVPECCWDGIQCNNKSQVVSIDFANRSMGTSILPEMGLLEHLQNLTLSNTGLTGTIPQTIVNLWSINKIDLSNNKLNGAIPNIPLHVEYLYLSNNEFEGKIPSNIVLTSRLKVLELQNNRLTGIPSLTLFQNFRLETLNISRNYIEGSLGSIEHLEKLEQFDVSDNFLTGSLPNGILSISSLIELNAAQNEFTGKIEQIIGKHSKLEKLDLSQNQLSGSIPPSISKLARLAILILQDNALTGPLPGTLANIEPLQTISVSYNELKGDIPDFSSDTQSLERIHLHGNQFRGNAPTLSGSNLDYITDCGFPSLVQDRVVCVSCSVCCNYDEFCQNNPGTKGLSINLQTVIYLTSLYGSLFVAYFAKGIYSQVLKVEIWEDIDLVEAMGEDSVYIFFLSRNVYAWVIAVMCSFFQILILYLFVNATKIQDLGSDWEYTMLCPAYDLSCFDEKNTTIFGYALFLVVMIAWLLKDVISWFKLLIYAVRLKSFDCFFGAIVLFTVSFLTVWTSILYNNSIATTNTELIVNAVILLFVTDLDEKMHDIVCAINPDWVKRINTEARNNVVNREGRGMLSKALKVIVKTMMPAYVRDLGETVIDENEVEDIQL